MDLSLKKLAGKLLPASTVKKLKLFYKSTITHYKRDIYSEFGEDFIAAVLLGFRKEGVYVDIGAFMPKELSTTYYFYYKLNWSGIIIEPNPRAKVAFSQQRPRDIFVNKGISEREGELNYYLFKDPTLNSFSAEVLDQNKQNLVETKKIPVQTMEAILDEQLLSGKHIDLMNIDTEGLDLEVLKSNNWQKYSPEIIIIEDHSFKPEDPLQSAIVQFLKERNYSLKSYCLISLIFQKNKNEDSQ